MHRVLRRGGCSRRVGWEDVHAVVDDCSRLSYAEIHYNERRSPSALGNRPPAARVRDVLGFDI